MSTQPDPPLSADDPFQRVSYEEWRRRLEEDLKGSDFDDLVETIAGGVDVEPLYTALAPDPGPIAVTRSLLERYPAPTPASAGLPAWVVCESFEQASAEELAGSIDTALAGGAGGVWLRLDKAARCATDPANSPDAIGRQGVPLYRARQFEDLMSTVAGRPELWILDAGGNTVAAAVTFLAGLDAAGVEPQQTSILFAADAVGAWVKEGFLPASPERIESKTWELAAYCHENLPAARALAVSTEPYHEAGADPPLELGIAAATLVHYLRGLEVHGLPLEVAASQFAIFTPVGKDLFLESAKLRAARLLWRRVFEACGVDRAERPWLHVMASRRSQTVRPSAVNLLRSTGATLAAAIGAANSISLPPYDEGSVLPSSRGRRLCRNTQAILAVEGQLTRVADPAAGSYYLEALTDKLCRAAWSRLQQIEDVGGILQAIRQGWIQDQIEASWQQRRDRLEQGFEPIAGINRFDQPEAKSTEAAREKRGAEVDSVLTRERSAQQAFDPSGIEPPGEGVGVEWCLTQAREGASMQQLALALYPASAAERVRPLEDRRESAGFEDNDGAEDV